jgi:hypothetical protein
MNSPFIIFSQSRSGSTLLRKLLDSHSHIHCEGEILTQTDGYLKSEFGQKTARLFTIPYLYRRKWPFKNKVYGATLFIYHGRYIARNILWLYKLGWKILYLEREDIVNQVLSNMIAAQTGHYHTEIKQKEQIDRHVLSEDSFINLVKNRIRWHAKEKSILKKMEFLRISYENDLMTAEKRERSLPAVFTYLSVSPEEVDTDLMKTYSRPYSQIVENYDSLMMRLKHDGLTELYEIHCHLKDAD